MLFVAQHKTRYCSLLILCHCVSVAFGGDLIYAGNASNVCENSLTSPANATGVEKYGMNAYSNGLGLWRVAVSTNSSAATIEEGRELTEASPGAAANLWLDPYEGIDLTDGSNSYSACAYVFKGLPYNTMLRGQHDDTSCTQMLSEKCVKAITWRAAETARWLVSSPTQGPFSNLTPPILSPICQDIFQGVGVGGEGSFNPFPKECVPFFDDGSAYPSADTLVLTSNVTLPKNCTFQRGYDRPHVLFLETYNAPPGFYYPHNSTNGSAAASYDELVQQMWPILTVTFPPANNSRQSSGSWAATMTCIRAGNVKADSRVPAALPAAKAVNFPVRLSRGAIAGIVVGSVIGVAVLAVVGWWLWRKYWRRSKVPGDKDEDVKSDLTTEPKTDITYQLDDKDATMQLDSKQRPAQLDSSTRAELGDVDTRPELPGSVAPQELPGSTPITPARRSSW